MMIDDWTNIRAAHEIKRLRRATFWIVLLDAVLICAFFALCYWTLTGFGQTTLSEGLARLADWIRGGTR